MQSFIMLNVILQNAIMLCVDIFGVIMLTVILQIVIIFALSPIYT
jgi:hypothetical protein